LSHPAQDCLLSELVPTVLPVNLKLEVVSEVVPNFLLIPLVPFATHNNEQPHQNGHECKADDS